MKIPISGAAKFLACGGLFSLLACAMPRAADAPAGGVTLRDFKLTGDLSGDNAAFTLTATAHVDGPRGGSLDLLAGPVALTEVASNPRWHVGVEDSRFVLNFDRGGDYPMQIKFSAAVKQGDGWNAVNFNVAPGTLEAIELRGLAADTQFQFAGAARPDRTGSNFESYLPSDGAVKLAWKEAPKEEEGKLFYAAQMLSQITVSPGLMQQSAFVDYKVMQGEVNEVAIDLHGAGEVTRVVGDHVLAWHIEPVTNSADRRLVVQFNEPQKDLFAVRIELQTPLGAFPQTTDAVRLRPEAATRFAGYFRIVNDGAVRLEVVNASGLSQVAPEQFINGDEYNWKPNFRLTGTQQFVYRFTAADFALRIQADQILPELSVSQVLSYHLGESELDVDAELELDIREAPLRELLLRVPKGYAIARLTAGDSLSDYFVSEPAGGADAELRLVFGQPVSGRQVVELRLEHNAGLGTNDWTLPRIEVTRAKSVRGNVGVAADAGFRLTAERTQALTEIATAFFPAKVTGLQAAFRLSDPEWEATVHVERLPQTVQADVLHLFSVGEGIAYGSSVINYVISGAPVSVFKVELSGEYFNVEFTGQDVRNWRKTEGGYLVSLHTPVSGPYTLLATYERPFQPKGETLSFTGARPLDAQSEQGYTLVISAYQFEVKVAELSPGLMPLEPGEVPAEYRLFFDAPILAAYRYTSRPFDLKLALSPLAQRESLSQVVDRASLTNRISAEGQVLTDVRYYLKNRGNTDFRLTLPPGTDLWSATVDGAAVVPAADGTASLIPLPPRGDPNAVLVVDLKLAARSPDARHLTLAAPMAGAPVMLEEWKMEPDAGRRLVFQKGSLTPAGGVVDASGFAGLSRLFEGEDGAQAESFLVAVVVLVGIAVMVWRRTVREDFPKSGARLSVEWLLGAGAFLLGLLALIKVGLMAGNVVIPVPRELTFVAPVQQPDSALTVQVSNLPERASLIELLGYAWPALLGLAVLGFAFATGGRGFGFAARITGGMLMAWAVLCFPNSAEVFFMLLALYLLMQVGIPAARMGWRMRRKMTLLSAAAATAGAPATIALLVGGLIWLAAGNAASAADTPALPESVTQQIRVEDNFALATANIRWHATRGDTLPLLVDPAVLTQVSYPTRALKLVQELVEGRRSVQLVAQVSGTFDIEVQYQMQVANNGAESGVTLPTPYGLINQLQLTLTGLDVDVISPQAVSVRRESEGSNTVATLVLSPLAGATVNWKPQSRDVTREKPVFYAEIYQLYAPSSGVIEGLHYAWIKPAQGQLSELIFNVPAGATITDVVDPGTRPDTTGGGQAAGESLVSLWRFDPDTHKLRVDLRKPQSRTFVVAIRSQVATGSIPFEQRVGLVSVEKGAGQIGLLGVATGNEVQLDAVTTDTNGISAINLEDFPGGLAQALQGQMPGLTVRRAYRYADAASTAVLKASAVEPDVRVETQDTLSLGEDRTVLAVSATADITRAGIFSLSFVLPAGMDVESITGDALSHWTESKSGGDRIITLHLKSKTEGSQQFAITLTGPGLKAASAWVTPQLVFREAGKQWGTLVVAPEQGMRLQVAARDGVTQLDPQKSGIQQKGVLAFRILQAPWNLALDIEQVDPWIQVVSLQHAMVNGAQVKITANLQYQIENTGLKVFHVDIPTNAEGVSFQGDQVSDFLPVEGAITNGLQRWEVKLHRRVIGPYLLQMSCQMLMPDQATDTTLRGVVAADVNMQRGFVTVQSEGRLEVRVDAPPAALQPAEWQSIPRALQQGLQDEPANFAYRLVEPDFELPLKLVRHEAAKLLSAQVQSVTLTSVISDDGVMLTHAMLELTPGDKRLLNLTLPPGAHFWFAFVDQNGVWPWREQDRILIPLEQQSRGSQPVKVEFFYTSQAGSVAGRGLDLELLGPKIDLPLENISWRVHLNDKWQLASWSGSLQLQGEAVVPAEAAGEAESYLQNEAGAQREKTKQAEAMLAMGNSLLENGDPQQARRAFQSAYGLSRGDDAFNEDARVQLNNLKLQQALVGLNVRQAEVGGGSAGVLGGSFRDLGSRKDVAYTQQDAKDIIDRNTADENAAFMRLAERLIQQQDAAVSSPATIRANIPEQGRVLTFQRSVFLDTKDDLKIGLRIAAVGAASSTSRALILGGSILLLAFITWSARPIRKRLE